MSQFWINFIFVIGSFIIYTAIAVWARAKSTREFYIAGGEVNPVMNGMATAADWLSAASVNVFSRLVVTSAMKA